MMIIVSLSNHLIYHISVSYGISWSKHYESINTGTACTMRVYSITFVKPASMTRGQQFIIAGHLRNFSHKQRLTRKWEQHSHSKLPRTVTYIHVESRWVIMDFAPHFFLYIFVYIQRLVSINHFPVWPQKKNRDYLHKLRLAETSVPQSKSTSYSD